MLDIACCISVNYINKAVTLSMCFLFSSVAADFALRLGPNNERSG